MDLRAVREFNERSGGTKKDEIIGASWIKEGSSWRKPSLFNDPARLLLFNSDMGSGEEKTIKIISIIIIEIILRVNLNLEVCQLSILVLSNY
jgi:hypothetical protein